jgi:hypothetical protein
VASAVRPGRNNLSGYLGALLGSVLAVLGGLIAFRRRNEPPEPEPASGPAHPVVGALLWLPGDARSRAAARLASCSARSPG